MKMLNYCSAVLAIFAISLSGAPKAQENNEQDMFMSFGGEEFVSIATGVEQPISKAPSVASVITEKDIEAMGARNLDQILESVPGLHVSVSSYRFSPVYQMRGIATDVNPQVLVLVNSIPITQLYVGDRGPRSALPVSNIERVEVIRGPGSAVYGADAFAGVINVITKDPDEADVVDSGVQIGSFDYRGGWLTHSGESNDLHYKLSVEYHETDGDDERIITRDAQTYFDSLFGTDASLAPGPAATQEKRIDIRAELMGENWITRFWNWRQEDVGLGPGIALALDTEGKTETDNYMLDFLYENQLSENLNFDVKTALLDLEFSNEFLIFPRGAVLPIGPDGNVGAGTPTQFPDGLRGNPDVFEEHFKLDTSLLYTGVDKHRVRIAVGYSYGKLEASETKNYGPGVINGSEGVVDGGLTDVTDTPYTFIENNDRSVYYISLQDEWRYAADWVLTMGVRHDKYSGFGSTTNPRLALVWNARHNLTAKMLYGRAFRAPAFAELFAINNPVVLGNPDLDPEIIDTVEFAIDSRPLLDLRVGVNVYAYDVEDLIRFVPDASGSSATAQNTGRQKGKGVEFELEWRPFETFSINGHIAIQDSENDRTGAPAAGAPEKMLYVDTRWEFVEGWSLNTQINVIANRNREASDPRPAIDDYSTVDVNARHASVDDSWSLSLGVRNLLDEDRREPSPTNMDYPSGSGIPNDFPLPGRNYYIEASYAF